MTVPHFFQSSEETCGPACLRMLFAAHGVQHDEATVEAQCGMTPWGCTLPDLVAGVQAFGFNGASFWLTGEPFAIATLKSDTPFVAMVELSTLNNQGPMLQWHFVVPLEIVNDEVIFHDPADGPNQRATLDDFLAAWGTAGYGGVRVWTP